MRFLSTRGQTPPARLFGGGRASGLAPDGGLFLPETLPGPEPRTFPGWQSSGTPTSASTSSGILRRTSPPASCGRSSRRSLPLLRTPTSRLSGRSARNSTSSNSSTARRSPSRTSRFSSSGNLYARQCRVRSETINVLGRDLGRHRGGGDPRASRPARAPRSSSSIRTEGSRRSRSGRWPAPGPRMSSRWRSTAPLTTPRRR